MELPPASSPRPPTTVRRNPPRRAKQTPLATAPGPSSLSSAAGGITPFPLDDILQPDPPQMPPPVSKSPEAKSADSSENLKVFLRIRPLEIGPRPSRKPCGSKAKPRGKCASPKGGKSKKKSSCLAVNDSHSVTLSAQPSLLDSKRTKSEVYDGFSFVFPQDSLQQEVYEKVMNPLVLDLMEGKNALLVAMGPTGSGKTHTMFGCPRDPGMLPLALRQIFSHATGNGDPHSSRSYYLSMFEIYSERGKGERILDLSPNGIDLSLQQSTMKGLQEVMVSSLAEAESLVACGMLKRATATTNSNYQSSRSQCIINIRAAHKNVDDEHRFPPNNAVLTIADLAGAERERKTGNQGARLSESNFINNTSMVFGLCLRSLLEHQKNRKKPLHKHFKNSLLTRYLKDYLEGKKRMTLILTVKPGEEDYADASFLLRQASPYMKIKFNNLEELANLHGQKRTTTSLIRVEHHKRMKIDHSEASLVDVGKVDTDANDENQMSKKEVNSKKLQESTIPHVFHISPISHERAHVGVQCNEEVSVELQKIKRNEEVMRNFAKALWNVLKQYKQKLEDSEREAGNLKEALRKEMAKTMELNKELKKLSTCCSFHRHPFPEEIFCSDVDAPYEYCAAGPFKPLSTTDDLTNCDALLDDNTPPEIGGQIHINMPAVVLAHEDFTELPEFGLEMDSSNSNPTSLDIKTANRDSSSSISCSIVDDRTICSSSKEMPTQQKEDKKMQTSDTAELSISPGDVKKLSYEKDKGFQEKANRTGDKEQLKNIDVREISYPEGSTDHVKITLSSSNVQKALVEEKNACSSPVKYSDSMCSSLSINKDAKMQAHKILYHKPESFQEQKQDHEDLQGKEDGPTELSCKPGPEEMHSSPEIHSQTHDHIKEGKDIFPSVSQQSQASYALSVRDMKTSNKCQLAKNLKEEKFDSISKPKVAVKHKRRLMPASAMLLREFAGLDMEINKPKESSDRLNADEKGRSDGSISLFRLLQSNLQH
ncbi:kinesin-like protein KIN-6 isoform X2 [Elaeis guineensis]|uniref:Kinesin-like protein KIN-6 isoform X1 n=1 Tax=Elaeis guineensis var. tenera TaxID=51953 RepID=A0A6J0PP02_ELAGV|nr:kinesin-like protein KIN-6 isoform X1 [Elaeis guineensis]